MLKQIKYFQTVVYCNSFSEAAYIEEFAEITGSFGISIYL